MNNQLKAELNDLAASWISNAKKATELGKQELYQDKATGCFMNAATLAVCAKELQALVKLHEVDEPMPQRTGF